MTKVKICGLTTLEDAFIAAEAGADFLGFILWAGSKRAITPGAVAAISHHLHSLARPPLLVGVFVNETAASVAEAMAFCRLDLAQLHGEEPPALIADPTSPLFGRVYKGLRPTSLAEAEAEAEWFAAPGAAAEAPSLLIDAYHPNMRGGTGQRADWQIAARLSALVPRLMLAGGLTPANVGEAVRKVRPFAVDVASGVESSPGRKERRLVSSFLAAVRETEKQNGLI